MARRKTKVSSGRRSVRGALTQTSISNRATAGANEEFDRETTITARSTGISVSATAQIKVVQLGMREPFIPADSDEPFETSESLAFGVLKQ